MQHDNYSLKKSIKSEKLNWFIKKTSWIFIISGRFTHPLLIVDSRFSLLLHWKFVQLKRIGRFGNILWSLSKCAELSWFSSSILSSSVVYFLLIICLSYRRFLYLLLITDTDTLPWWWYLYSDCVSVPTYLQWVAQKTLKVSGLFNYHWKHTYLLYTRGRLLDEGAMLDENFTQQYQIRS